MHAPMHCHAEPAEAPMHCNAESACPDEGKTEALLQAGIVSEYAILSTYRPLFCFPMLPPQGERSLECGIVPGMLSM